MAAKNDDKSAPVAATDAGAGAGAAAAGAVNLTKEVQTQKEWAKTLVFTADGKVLANTFGPKEVREDEIPALLAAHNDRDATVGKGIVVGGLHYEVHRFHDDYIYGRRLPPGEGAGFCLYRRVQKKTKKPFFFLITYLPPALSARIIPQLVAFVDKHVESL